MQPGFIAGAGSTSPALQTGSIDMTAAAAVETASRFETASRLATEARRGRLSARSLYPVVRGIVFALPLSMAIWAGILFLSFR